jgi:hypothetical protein
MSDYLSIPWPMQSLVDVLAFPERASTLLLMLSLIVNFVKFFLNIINIFNIPQWIFLVNCKTVSIFPYILFTFAQERKKVILGENAEHEHLRPKIQDINIVQKVWSQRSR